MPATHGGPVNSVEKRLFANGTFWVIRLSSCATAAANLLNQSLAQEQDISMRQLVTYVGMAFLDMNSTNCETV